MLFAFALFLPACVTSSECSSERIDVADDETALGDLPFTVDELLAGLEGIRTFPASDDAGAPLSAELDIERGEGSAVLVDTTVVEVMRWGLQLFGNDQPFLVCEDRVEVPVAFSLTTTDGTIAVEGDTQVRAEEGSSPGGSASLSFALDPAAATLPTPADGAEGAEFDAWFDGENLKQASLSWLGTDNEALTFPPVQASR